MQGINGYYTELDKVNPPITANQSHDERSLTSNGSLRSRLKTVILETGQHGFMKSYRRVLPPVYHRALFCPPDFLARDED